jgi:hypothetical protein
MLSHEGLAPPRIDFAAPGPKDAADNLNGE